MKKIISILLSIVAMVSVVTGMNMTGYAANTTTVNLIGAYGQTEARKMLNGINSFRKNSDAWFWNSDNKTKTVCRNLKDLTYDYELERTAMLRAAEVAAYWSHTRPNGKDCFSAFTYAAGNKGEIIAAGSSTWESTLRQWREDNEKYGGQGHRRIMLNNSFTVLGVGHFKCAGIDYWVTEFAVNGKSSKTVTANNSETNVPISVLTANITSASVQLNNTSINVNEGNSVSLPNVTTTLNITNHWPAGRPVPVKVAPTWTSSNTSVAAISGASVSAKKSGLAKLTAKCSIAGKSASASVNVSVNAVTRPQNGWFTLSGKTFFYKNSQPVKYRNWIDGKLYYFNGAGIMQTGWIKGANTFYADANGVLRIGWACIAGKKYYFKSDGSMAVYTNTINGKTYYFNGAGVMHTGWLKYNTGKWSYFDGNGVMFKNGSLKTNTKTYKFNASGECTNR